MGHFHALEDPSLPGLWGWAPSSRQTTESQVGNVLVQKKPHMLGQPRCPAAGSGLWVVTGLSRDECDTWCKDRRNLSLQSCARPVSQGSGHIGQEPGWYPTVPPGGAATSEPLFPHWKNGSSLALPQGGMRMAHEFRPV